ncbi:TonB family protein [Pseudomonas sp. NY15354]|uniref:energy transducer TonB n=1 Tax=Pseudomonas sp. NY15354 TaxID=3400351 RepID=UPI003A85D2FA
MTSLTLQQPMWPALREHGSALAIAVALHAGAAWLLFSLSHTPELPAPAAQVIQTQLVQLPAPEPVVAAPTVVESAPVAPVPKPQPTVQAPPVEDAALALKRVQQQERRERKQREESERREQLARDEKAREAREQAQRLAAARDTEAARQAATAKARAEADAASRQYLPIAKEAPDYPQRALDRHIEGECMVAYTVDPSGRVTDPQVVGNCHPLFVKPSLAAAKRFRYQPRLINGQAVSVHNVRNKFTYEIR